MTLRFFLFKSKLFDSIGLFEFVYVLFKLKKSFNIYVCYIWIRGFNSRTLYFALLFSLFLKSFILNSDYFIFLLLLIVQISNLLTIYFRKWSHLITDCNLCFYSIFLILLIQISAKFALFSYIIDKVWNWFLLFHQSGCNLFVFA